MTTLRLAAALIGLLSLSLIAGCDAHSADKEEITRVYDDLERFNDSKNGAAVLELFTQETFPVYDKLLKLGLDGTAEQVKALGPLEKMEVLRMRARGKRSELAGLSGREYMEWATSQGWYITTDEDRGVWTLRKFRFAKDGTATTEAVLDGEPTGVRLRFVRQGERWRFDEPHAIRQWDPLFRRAAREEGMSVDEFVVQELSKEIKREVPESVWEPMPDDKKPPPGDVIKPERTPARKKR